MEWLQAQVVRPGVRNILLTHHQLFSPFESRAFDRTLHTKVAPILPSITGWFWGHEHRPIVFADHQGIRARCVGRGAVPANVPCGTLKFGVPVAHVDERAAPGTRNTGIHGFALVTISGPTLQVEYIDEFGALWFTESWRLTGSSVPIWSLREVRWKTR